MTRTDHRILEVTNSGRTADRYDSDSGKNPTESIDFADILLNSTSEFGQICRNKLREEYQDLNLDHFVFDLYRQLTKAFTSHMTVI